MYISKEERHYQLMQMFDKHKNADKLELDSFYR